MTFQIERNKLIRYEGDEEYVTLPQEVEELGEYAFYGASHLKSVTFHDQVKEIGAYAFYNCESLEEIELPDSVYYMDSAVFSRCLNLKRVRFSNALTALPKITFYQCHNLQEVVLPQRLSRINRACFEQCTSLEHISLPDTLKAIDDNAFDACTALKEINLPEGIQTIGNNVFYECRSLKHINLPLSLKSIGKGALETQGELCVISNDELLLKAEVFDNNWNMNWNFGSNHRYNGHNEDNYNLVESYLPKVIISQWKPLAQCVLSINYLEAYHQDISFYDEWIGTHKSELLDMIIARKRYAALNKALDLELIDNRDVDPYLDKISDREEKARLLDRQTNASLDDLFDML